MVWGTGKRTWVRGELSGPTGRTHWGKRRNLRTLGQEGGTETSGWKAQAAGQMKEGTQGQLEGGRVPAEPAQPLGLGSEEGDSCPFLLSTSQIVWPRPGLPRPLLAFEPRMEKPRKRTQGQTELRRGGPIPSPRVPQLQQELENSVERGQSPAWGPEASGHSLHGASRAPSSARAAWDLLFRPWDSLGV